MATARRITLRVNGTEHTLEIDPRILFTPAALLTE
jgi:hypothetical protein